MHLFHMGTLIAILALVGVEFTVSAFINPAARQLDPVPQLKLLSRLASVFGKVMPVWYPVCALLLGVETWLYWHAPERPVVLAALLVWLLASVASIVFLVPMNTRIAEGAAGWQQIHHIWDRRHRVRVAALAVAAALLTYALVR